MIKSYFDLVKEEFPFAYCILLGVSIAYMTSRSIYLAENTFVTADTALIGFLFINAWIFTSAFYQWWNQQ